MKNGKWGILQEMMNLLSLMIRTEYLFSDFSRLNDPSKQGIQEIVCVF